MPVVKRYPNRKMYNTETKQYITLDELADLIRRGEELHVYDHATGEDLTALTLTQILFEQVKKQTGFLPRTLLTGLIQAGGDRLSAIQRILTSTLGFGPQVDEEIQRRIRILVDQGNLSIEEGQNLQRKLLALSTEPYHILPTDTEVVEKVLSEREVASRNEIHMLLDQIEALSSKVDELSAK